MTESDPRQGFKFVAVDLTTRDHEFSYLEALRTGEPITADDPTEHDSPRPRQPGDGLCVALTVAAASSGGQSASSAVGLLVEFDEADVLAEAKGKVRVRALTVTDVFDPMHLIRLGLCADLQYADLRCAILHYADLHGANLHGANLYNANLRDANLHGAALDGANLDDANLCGANLSDANLEYADLRDANLHGANLRGADLRNADLRYADLRGANLHGANLRGANLRGTNVLTVSDSRRRGGAGVTGRANYLAQSGDPDDRI